MKVTSKHFVDVFGSLVLTPSFFLVQICIISFGLGNYFKFYWIDTLYNLELKSIELELADCLILYS